MSAGVSDTPPSVPPEIAQLVVGLSNLASALAAIDGRLERLEAVFKPRPGEFAGAPEAVGPPLPDGTMTPLVPSFVDAEALESDRALLDEGLEPVSELDVMHDSIANDWRSIVAQPGLAEQLLIALFAPLRVLLDNDLDDTQARVTIGKLVGELDFQHGKNLAAVRDHLLNARMPGTVEIALRNLYGDERQRVR